jgi:hypothetical protein
MGLPERRERPAQKNQTPSKSIATDTSTIAQAVCRTAELDPFSWAVLTDVWLIGHRLWWLKRARDFENAKPLPGEFHGNATREQLSARWRWCDEVARACRAKAELVGIDGELEQLLRDVA